MTSTTSAIPPDAITNTGVNRVAIVTSIITRYIFDPRKHRTVTLSICLCSVHQFSLLLVVSSSTIIHHCFLVFLPVVSICIDLYLILLLFVQSVLFDYCVFDYSASFSPDSGIVFQVFWSHITSSIRQVNKHHTPDCTIFCFNIGSKGLLQL